MSNLYETEAIALISEVITSQRMLEILLDRTTTGSKKEFSLYVVVVQWGSAPFHNVYGPMTLREATVAAALIEALNTSDDPNADPVDAWVAPLIGGDRNGPHNCAGGYYNQQSGFGIPSKPAPAPTWVLERD